MAPVVLVHGFLAGPASMWPLDRRIQRAGFDTHRFAYATRHIPLDQAAMRLFYLSQRLRAETVHWVGHSLGGLVILRMFEQCMDQCMALPSGRVILLGSPVQGSMASTHFAKRLGGRWMLGEAQHSLTHSFKHAPVSHPTTVIAGTLSLGMGAWWGDLPKPHDGTVSVAETKLAGARCIEVSASHSGLLVSKQVAHEVISALT